VKTRLELAFRFGKGPRVLAFVHCTGEGVSFGLPKVYRFEDYTITPKSENYERITVHLDGKVKTHFPLAQDFEPPWDKETQPYLKDWNKVWVIHEEVGWTPGLERKLLSRWAYPPKVGDPNIESIEVQFPRSAQRTVVTFGLLDSYDRLNQIPMLQNLAYWILKDSFPIVLVTVRGPKIAPYAKELVGVGRDYRTVGSR
jgi:hypothetical protein